MLAVLRISKLCLYYVVDNLHVHVRQTYAVPFRLFLSPGNFDFLFAFRSPICVVTFFPPF